MIYYMTAVYKKSHGFSLFIEALKLDIKLIIDQRKLPESTVGYIGDLTDEQAFKIIRIGVGALDTGSLASFQILSAEDIEGQIKRFSSLLHSALHPEGDVDPIYMDPVYFEKRLAEYRAQLAAIKGQPPL